MKKFLLILSIALIGYSPILNATNYGEGVFFINEDWYGHNNGTVNFLSNDGTWHYRVFQKENPGHELGSTSQFGTVYGDKFYIVSKQDKDPGASIQGSRLTVCEAATMKVLKEFVTVGNGDGRSFLGVDEHKGYIGTSNGVWIYDIEKMDIGEMIEGTGVATGGSLYNNQIGNMIRVGNRVFAVHQQKGVIVINPQTDIVETVLDGFYGSIVLSKDGNLWVSVAKDASGSGNSLDKIIKINPHTLVATEYQLPLDMGIPNSWYAWTADGFCASKQENKLYWKNNGGWFASKYIYCYDIDSNSVTKVADFGDWGIYGAGFRVNPVTDEIFCTLSKGFQSDDYKVVKINLATSETVEYPLISNYWFPAMVVFPDNHEPLISDSFNQITISENTTLSLFDMVTDADNLESAIVPSILSVSDNNVVTASIVGKSLEINPISENGNAEIEIKFNSNGKIVIKKIKVTVQNASSINDNITNNTIKVFPNPTSDYINVNTLIGSLIQLYSVNGELLYEEVASTSITKIELEAFQSGLYILKANNCITKIIKK